MANSNVSQPRWIPAVNPDAAGTAEPARSAMSWSAVFAGAASAAALSLILLMLGAGLGLSTISPWHTIDSAAQVGVVAILWLTITQLAASALGGYLAGRLRIRWSNTHPDEVYFRDTAHGLLTWAVATLATAMLLASSVSSIIGTGVESAATAAGSMAGSNATPTSANATSASTNGASTTTPAANGMASLLNPANELDYWLDNLLRPPVSTDSGTLPARKPGDPATPNNAVENSTRQELSRIFMHALPANEMSAEDQSYASQLVAQHTGLTPLQARTRVASAYAELRSAGAKAAAEVRQHADQVRKASQYALLWMFIALLAGAFIASWMAAFGGRLRDN